MPRKSKGSEPIPANSMYAKAMDAKVAAKKAEEAETTKVVPTVELDMGSFREDILQAVHFGIRAQAEAFLQHAHAEKRMMEQMSVAEVISEFLEFCKEHPLTGK